MTALPRLNLAALALIVVRAAYAGEPGTAGAGTKPGLNIKGELTPKDDLDTVRAASRRRVHLFKMEKGQHYRIDLKSTRFDAYLRVEDAKGNPLAEDDDSGGGTNARVLFSPERTDTYRLIVTTYEPITFAKDRPRTYELTARPVKRLLEARGQLTALDRKLDAKVRPNCHYREHPLKMLPGHTYTIDLRSSDFDGFLRLETLHGDLLAEDDDSGGGTNARITFTPKREAIYRILATTYGPNATGSYTLTVQE
jgi:hypothetical protein